MVAGAAGAVIVAAMIVLRFAVAPPTPAEAAPLAPVAVSGDLVGQARVIDGDGLWIDGAEVRLNGVDAFDLRQTCGDVECGIEARRALHRMVADRIVACRVVTRDQAGRAVSDCSVDGMDINAALVREGHALAQPSSAYVDEQTAARAEHAGAWAGVVTAIP